MKTIYKLVLKSYLGPMVLTFFIIMFVLMMNVLWRYIDELVGKGLDPGTIIELLCYATINMIPMALPLATLLAAIMTMGNLGENYELLAMKSAGMSLPKIMRPLLVVVSILAVGSFFIANNLVPYANKKFFRTIYDIRQMNQTLEFQDGLFFNGIDGMSIRVGHQNQETGLLTDVLIYDNRNASGNMTTTSTANATNRPEIRVSGTTKVPCNAINSSFRKPIFPFRDSKCSARMPICSTTPRPKTSPSCNTKSTR